jgi:peptidoglycan hydrolase-like protein with peptidoglycan-binding domain
LPVSDLELPPESENLLPTLQPRPRRRGQLLLRVGVVLATAAMVLAAAIGTYAYVFGGSSGGTGGVNGRLAAALEHATTTTRPPRHKVAAAKTSTTLGEPPVVALPDLGGQILHVGSTGPIVLAYEARLKQLHFDPGPVDGVYDQDTAYAVETVEKLFGGSRDGQIGPGVRFALSTFQWPKPGIPNGEPDRVEIDLDKQVLTLYKGGQIALITTTSTGSGRAFCGGDDGCQYAITPAGKFAFTWHHNGWYTSKLGHLYNPYYFNGGIAVHGFPDVPNVPASHGCARIPMNIAQYFPTLVSQGMPVYVLGTPAKPIGVLPKTPPTTTTTKPATVTAATTPASTGPKPKKPAAKKPAPTKKTTTTTSSHHP